MRKLFPILLLFAADAAIARDKDAWRDAKPAGDPQTCIPLDGIRESRVRDDRTIDFYMRNGKVYRNVLPNACPSLAFEKRFSYRTSLNQLCAPDIIHVLYITAPYQGPGCGLGRFQPVTGAGR